MRIKIPRTFFKTAQVPSPHPCSPAAIDAINQKVVAIFEGLVDLKARPEARGVMNEITALAQQAETLRYELATLSGQVNMHGKLNG